VTEAGSPRGDPGRRSSVWWALPRSQCGVPVQKVQHWTGGGHRPMVLVRLLWQRLVPMCPGVILDRATSRAVLRTRGAGTSAHQQARPRRRWTWSL